MTNDARTHGERIDRHYSANQAMFSFFWSKDYLRWGLWEDGSWSLKKALRRTDEHLARILNPAEEDHILDAGCGIGGSAIYLAENYGSKITGINLCGKQLDMAKQKAARAGLDHLVSFEKGDFTATGLPDESFSLIYGIESVYHAENLQNFTDESFRLLKPGGTLVVIDRFLTSKPLTAIQKKQYDTFRTGQAVNKLPTVNELTCALEKSGYTEISFEDQTSKVLRGVKLSVALSRLALPQNLLLCGIGVLPKEVIDLNKSLLAIGKMFKNGIVSYGTSISRKGPHKA